MNHFQAALLGIFQGLTEFLPVSSSGHLVIAQSLLGVNPPGVTVEVVLHLGTLMAVLIVYSNEVYGITTALFRGAADLLARRKALGEVLEDPDFRLGMWVVLGTIPTGIIGLFFKPVFERLFDSVSVIGMMLLVTGVFLWVSRVLPAGTRGIGRMKPLDSLLIGAVQGLAIIPGISRSGSTIVTGLAVGLRPETAANFSFLLSIPAVLAAAVLDLPDALGETAGVEAGSLLTGFLASVVAGYLAIRFLLRLVRRGRLDYFAYYVWAVGLLVLVLELF